MSVPAFISSGLCTHSSCSARCSVVGLMSQKTICNLVDKRYTSSDPVFKLKDESIFAKIRETVTSHDTFPCLLLLLSLSSFPTIKTSGGIIRWPWISRHSLLPPNPVYWLPTCGRFSYNEQGYIIISMR
jgi:hypothetical protein